MKFSIEQITRIREMMKSLKKHEVDEFIKAAEKQWSDKDALMEYYEHLYYIGGVRRLISGCFSWDDTEQGYDYWYRIYLMCPHQEPAMYQICLN